MSLSANNCTNTFCFSFFFQVVLGVISSLVGIAGIFAKSSSSQLRDRLALDGIDTPNSSPYCSLHPRSWDFRFNTFIIALYGVLSLITLLCAISTELKRIFSSKARMRPNSRISSVGDLVLDPQSSTEALAKSNTGSYRSLYGIHSMLPVNQETLRKNLFGKKFRSIDLRWAAVLAVIGLSYAVNHGPSMVSICKRAKSANEMQFIAFSLIFGAIFINVCAVQCGYSEACCIVYAGMLYLHHCARAS